MVSTISILESELWFLIQLFQTKKICFESSSLKDYNRKSSTTVIESYAKNSKARTNHLLPV